MNTCPRCGLPMIECQSRRDSSDLECHADNMECGVCGLLLRQCRARKANPELACYLDNPVVEPDDDEELA